MTPDSIVLGPLEFVRDGDEMFVNRLAVPGDPDGDGDHIATAEGVWDDVWAGFLRAVELPSSMGLCDTCGDARGYLWPHATNDRTDHSYVERCDGCQRFESDTEAAVFVAKRLADMHVDAVYSAADVGLSTPQPYVDLVEDSGWHA